MLNFPAIPTLLSYSKKPALLNRGVLLFTLFWSVLSYALSPPVSQQIIPAYTAESSPVVSINAHDAKPIAVGGASDESGQLSLQAKTDTLDVPMDAYFGFIAPRLLGNTLWIVTQSGSIQPISSGLAPWKTNITSLDE